MPNCAAFGCNFQSKGNKGSDVSLHSFPKEKKIRNEWEVACGRVQLPKDPRLCSRHFSPDAFEVFSRLKELTGAASYKRRLKPNAVPSIFPHKKHKRPHTASESRANKRERQAAVDTLLLGCKQPAPAVAKEESSGTTPIMEVMLTENPPDAVNESTVTLSLQCSPSMADAATQTEVSQSDAAVQWPADVDYPVKMDHIYTGVGEIEIGVQEDDIDNSQDLYFSDDELGKQSQPQYSHFDPEYIEEVKELKNEGSQLTLELTCAKSCSYRWQSQPTMSGTEGIGNLLLTASVFFSGIHFAKFERFCSNMNLKTISEDTYTSLRKKFVFPVIEKTWIKEQSAVLTTMKSQEEVVLCGDGWCDSPGHPAKYCTYTFLDAQSQKVVDFKVISCTQVSSSNTMEIKGFKEALKTIEENGVKVSAISTDRHPQIIKEMRVSNPEKHHEFDPWHVAKGVSKKLATEAKRRECEGLGQWIPSIVNHLWWSAQSCDGNAEVLKEKWISVIHHVTNRHDWPGNRHYHQCSHEPLDETSQRRKLWLKPGSEAHNALVKVVTHKRLLKDLDHLTKCIHTAKLEVYHSIYLKYLPKRTHFGYHVMIHASMLAALDHNNNVNREQAVLRDGESVGEPKFKISCSKVHKTFRAKDYSYMTAMIADVLSSVLDSRTT
ncbi:hypothetical protein F2P79_020247 [Pimephales promelas]|nr:hypothetical protein F2P79_020247 [Pimephales promelas]